MNVVTFENAAIGTTTDQCDGCGDVVDRSGNNYGSVTLTGDVEDAYAFCSRCWPTAKAVTRRLSKERRAAMVKEQAIWDEFLEKQRCRTG